MCNMFSCPLFYFQLRKLRMFDLGSGLPSKVRRLDSSDSGLLYAAKKRSMVLDSWMSWLRTYATTPAAGDSVSGMWTVEEDQESKGN